MKKTLLALGLATSLSLPFTPVYGKSNAELPLDEIRNFVDVYNAIRNEYVEEENGKVLIDYAIEGMLNGLDPHSIYLKKEDLEDFKEDADGSYEGYGIQLELDDGKLIIVSPIPNSPAEAAGIKANDRIIKIGDTVIDNLSMPEISRMLKVVDTVTLTIMRKGEETLQIELSKSTVNLPSVEQKVLDKKYGYLRVTQFQRETAEQFEIALTDLLKADVEGVVLDLRNNPGGLIHAATGIADMFLDAGLIVSTKNQNTGTEDKTHASKETLAAELPLVVLINEGSASASELLAGALQSHKRAVVVGQRSFGKGSVQNVIPLDNGGAIKLTTARYYTPSGDSIQATGITPDIVLSQLVVEDKDVSLLTYGEADIPKHLHNDNEEDIEAGEGNHDDTEANDTDDTETPDADEVSDVKNDTDVEDTADEALPSKSRDDWAKSDLQLFEALNVLKVLIFKQ